MSPRRLVTTAAALLALLALVPAVASAVNEPPGGGGGSALSYVALGDSYASGEGLSPFQKGSDTSSDQCHRSLRSYPMLLHSEIALGKFHDYACSGATTDKLWIGVQYKPEGSPQALHAPLRHAQLVTVTVGGDDLGFASDLSYCFKHTYCQRDKSFAAKVNRAFAELPSDLNAAYDTIRRNHRKNATIVVVGYPRIFPTIKSHQQCQIIHGHFGYGYEDSEQDYFNAKAIELDKRVAAAAKRAGFFFVSPLKAFLGHAPCDPNPWINGISIRSDGNFTTKASFHPNTKGQRAYANIVEDWLAYYHGNRNPDGLPRDPKPTRKIPKPPPECRPGKPC